MPLSLGITLSPRVIPILQISFDGKGKERKGKERKARVSWTRPRFSNFTEMDETKRYGNSISLRPIGATFENETRNV